MVELMARPQKWDSDLQRRKAQNELRKAVRANSVPEFVGIDGEGCGKWRDHKYVLLGVGRDHISSPDGLSWSEIFPFLWGAYEDNPAAVYCGFYLGYDFTQWLKTLPQGTARLLFDDRTRVRDRSGDNRTPFPVRHEGWEFDILGMKRLKLRKEGAKTWMYICDAGPFFQAPFLKVIDPKAWNEPVVSQEEYESIKEGKSRRDTAELDEDMVRYNTLENECLARVLRRLARGISATGAKLKRSQWFGPGQAAQAWLSLQSGVPKPSDLPVLAGELARLTYYGGWFEIMAHGHVPGITYEYDINSAYPYVISRLPCLLHGEWTKDSNERDFGDVTIVHAKVKGSNSNIGSMPHRHPDGRVLRPLATAGWYWYNELKASERAGLIDEYKILDSYSYTPCTCPPPLRGLVGLYEYRQRIGKNTPEGKAAKLVYNSIYGKFAQSIGYPTYGNAIYASLITSGCRTQILQAIATHPKQARDVLMVATDGIYFRTKHPGLPISQALGEWDYAEKENLTLFKPGVYWDDTTRNQLRNGDNPSFKSRGINAQSFSKQIQSIDDHYSRWTDTYPEERDPHLDREGWHPKIKYVSGFNMVTCLQAIQRNKWFLAGAVSSAELTQDADPISKRAAGRFDGQVYWSRPHRTGGPEAESTPYEKRFGLPELNPEDYGLTPDGWNLDSWRELLR